MDAPEPSFSLLIDGGKSALHPVQSLKARGGLRKEAGLYRVDLLIATHHDKDHLEGLIDVVNDPDFKVDHAWVPLVFKPALSSWFPGDADETLSEAAIRDPDVALHESLAAIQLAVEPHLRRLPETRQDQPTRTLWEELRELGSSRGPLRIPGFADLWRSVEGSRPVAETPTAPTESPFAAMEEVESHLIQRFPVIRALVYCAHGLGALGCANVPAPEFRHLRSGSPRQLAMRVGAEYEMALGVATQRRAPASARADRCAFARVGRGTPSTRPSRR